MDNDLVQVRGQAGNTADGIRSSLRRGYVSSRFKVAATVEGALVGIWQCDAHRGVSTITPASRVGERA